DGLVGDGRVAGQSHLVLVLRLEQVGPILGNVLDDGRVHFEREDAVVVAVPGAVRVLGGGGDGVPGRDLVRLDQAIGLGGRPEGQADVDDVRSLGTLVVLVRLDRLDLVAGAAVGVQAVDRNAVLRGE